MQKKKLKKVIFILTILSLLASGGTMNFTTKKAKAATSNARDLLSTSAVSATGTSTVTFTTETTLEIGEIMDVDLSAFSDGWDSGDVSCPANTNESAVGEVARCTAAAQIAGGNYTITVTDVINPTASGTINVIITTRQSDLDVIETLTIKVAITDQVVVTATVPQTLTFTIAPLASGTQVNGAGSETTITSATTTLAFGNLDANDDEIMGQQLTVVTNADDGYTVTVEQDQDLTSGGNSLIDSFKDGAGTVTPEAWEAPDLNDVLDSYNTYGYMGFTSEDATLSWGAGGDPFGTNLWRGFASTTPVEVMYHTGPANGSDSGVGVGMVKVAYRIEVTPLQEAGDYTNTLTYICTPTF